MAAYDIFTMIDNGLMEPLTETTNSTITHRYCALAAQLKEVYALYNIFMATICLCSRFIINGYKKPITQAEFKDCAQTLKTERKKGEY
ncbi:hypothetical protein [Bartonella sp. AC535YNZD]|uniref:hypothetical protein n=1 Tax=Bartonella sp. AC535YNZD TaxID=3243455 RepID=UPI0035D0A1AD